MKTFTFNTVRFLWLAFILLSSCKAPSSIAKQSEASKKDTAKIHFTILQLNDVYEIGPQENGRVGGLARVAILRRRLLEETPNVLTVLAGDFLSPSLIGTLKLNGKAIRGKQMVEVLNELGLDVVAFGNHEFDLKEQELLERIDETKFAWIATNVLHKTGSRIQPFTKTQPDGSKAFLPEAFLWNIPHESAGAYFTVGIFSACIDDNHPDYVYFEDPYQEATKAYSELLTKTNVVLGLTHLELPMDLKMAGMLPQTMLIMGGHEHDHSIDTVGTVVVTKADANAKTVWVHRFTCDYPKGPCELRSSLVAIDTTFAFQPDVQAIVEKWEKVMEEQIAQVVPNPREIIYTTHVPLDGREKSIRNQQTNLGQLIAKSMAFATGFKVEAAILNSGSVRLDDQLSGYITPVDIFRALPYGGKIYEVRLDGALFKRVLDSGRENRGKGGYLQWYNITWDETNQQWLIGGKPIDPSKEYNVAMGEYLWQGREAGLEFLNPQNMIAWSTADNDDNDDLRSDIRKAVVAYLKSLK